VEALAADLRERAAGRVIDRADVAEISVLKTYDPPLTALRGRVITGTESSSTWSRSLRQPRRREDRCT